MKTSNSVLSAVVVSVLGLSAALNAPQALAVDDKIYPRLHVQTVRWHWLGPDWL